MIELSVEPKYYRGSIVIRTVPDAKRRTLGVLSDGRIVQAIVEEGVTSLELEGEIVQLYAAGDKVKMGNYKSTITSIDIWTSKPDYYYVGDLPVLSENQKPTHLVAVKLDYRIGLGLDQIMKMERVFE